MMQLYLFTTLSDIPLCNSLIKPLVCNTYAFVTLTIKHPGTCSFKRYQDRHCPLYCAEVITDFQSAKSMRTDSTYTPLQISLQHNKSTGCIDSLNSYGYKNIVILSHKQRRASCMDFTRATYCCKAQLTIPVLS